MRKVFNSVKMAGELETIGVSVHKPDRAWTVAEFTEDAAALALRIGAFCDAIENADSAVKVDEVVQEFSAYVQHFAYHAVLAGALDIETLKRHVLEAPGP